MGHIPRDISRHVYYFIKTEGGFVRRYWRRSGVFIVNFEHVIAGWVTCRPKSEPYR